MAKNTTAVGTAPSAEELQLQKIISESVEAAIEEAAGDNDAPVMSLAEARAAAKGEDDFFNPTLSQFKEGMVINTNETLCKIKRVPVGKQGNSAWRMTCPCGRRNPDGTIEYTGAFHFFPSSLRKVIMVTDENGEPTLDDKMQQEEIKADNEVWRAARACKNSSELLDYASNKIFLVGQIKRGFGPSGFMEINGVNRPTGHKLTSAPSFSIIG